MKIDAQKRILREDHQSGLLVKTYYIDSLEYFDKKRPDMIDLANRNKARVYLAMTRKNRVVCNRIIAKKIIDEIDNPNIRYDHLIRSSVCGCHISDYKWWTLDVDNNTTVFVTGLGKNLFNEKIKEVKLVDLLPELVPQMKNLVNKTKMRSGDEIFTVPTKNGCHVMTPPFYKDYLFGADDGTGLFRLEDSLKTDAMTLAYFQWEGQ